MLEIYKSCNNMRFKSVGYLVCLSLHAFWCKLQLCIERCVCSTYSHNPCPNPRLGLKPSLNPKVSKDSAKSPSSPKHNPSPSLCPRPNPIPNPIPKLLRSLLPPRKVVICCGPTHQESKRYGTHNSNQADFKCVQR
jgi:hypothetical protein